MRNKILEILLENMDSYITGEFISSKLGVTRTAVWKNINLLKKNGFRIDSIHNKGYLLKEIPDIYDELLFNIELKTVTLGRAIEIHHTLDSTNNRAKKLALEGAPHGMLVISDCQVNGRGRRGRSWESPAGIGLWMSLILRPFLPPQRAQQLTIIAAMSTAIAIEKVTGLKTGIKWPNDIIINNKKVCGILAEIQAEPELINFVVMGIGINVNGRPDMLLGDIKNTAETLENAAGRKIRRIELAASILKRFELLYNEFIGNGSLDFLLKGYKEYSVTLSKQVRVIGPVDSFEGTAVDISGDGGLLVQLNDGTVQKVLSGDVSVRGLAGYV